MNRRTVASLCFLATALPLTAFGIEVKSTTAPKAIVATAGDAKITLEEVDAVARPGLIRFEQFEYLVRRRAAEDLIFRKLIQQEAKRQNISVADLREREVLSKARNVPEEEIKDFIDRNPGLPEDPKQARAAAIEGATKLREKGIEDLYRKRLFERYPVDIALPAPRVPLPLNASDPSRGAAGAPVTIVEYSDFECPGCRQVHKLLADLQASYGNKVRLVFKQFPLSIHPEARIAAEASLCAAEQGKFWELHDWMFEHQDSLKVDALSTAVDLDKDAFVGCVKEKKYAATVDREVAGGEDIGVAATPTLFVNGRELMSGVSEAALRELIDEELRHGLKGSVSEQ